MAATAGDPLGLPQDTPGAQGINDDRITAFMRDYLDDVEVCGLSRIGRQPTPVATRPLSLADRRCRQAIEGPHCQGGGKRLPEAQLFGI
jgi:hypothetical protein